MPDDVLTPSAFDVVFGFVSAAVVIIIVAAIVTAVYRATRLTRQGVNPLTLQQDLEVQALRSGALAPTRSKADRLDELDLLRSTGRVSDDEHAAARARILAE